MFIKTRNEIVEYSRKSKCGIEHKFIRRRTVAEFLCDNCGEGFSRPLKKIQSKRLSNNYFHCCSACDAKKFAQRKGVERKQIWDMPASLDWPVGKY